MPVTDLEERRRIEATFLSGGGDMGERMRSLDWNSTPLGPVQDWPQSLRTSVSTCLNCAFPILIWWGPELAMLYNDDYRPILGDKHPRALGQMGRECWPEIWEVIGPMLHGVLEQGVAARAEDLQLLLNRSGYIEECYFSFSYSPIRDESGGVAGVFTPVKETTDKVIGERRLRTLNELALRGMQVADADEACEVVARTLAGNPHDLPFALLYRVGDDGRHATLCAQAGLAPATPASPTRIAFDDPDAAWPLAAAVQRRRMQTVEDLTVRVGTLPGGAWPEPPREAVILPIVPPGQEQASALMVVALNPRKRLDVAYRAFLDQAGTQIAAVLADAQAYEAERRRADALAEIDRAKTAFFSNVSHEFRTPLTLMLGPLEEWLAGAHGALDDAQRASLEVAHRNSLRLLKLVNSLLDFSRIEAKRAQARYAPVDLAALTVDLASNFRSLTGRAGLSLQIDCPALPVPVHVDRDMWEKIVLNLLSNAFKFTHEGGIEVSLRAQDRHAVLRVRDTGIGIDAADLTRVFERFHRVEGVHGRTHEGSGIGLALVQELVRLHGGTVEAASRPGEGATFTVKLPFGTAHLPAERLGTALPASTATGAGAYVEEALRWLAADASDPGDPAVPATGRRPRVLLADDNADMRDYVQRLLAPHYEVEAVADGQAALEAARRRAPELVLSDVMMPGLDGFGLLAALRADPVLGSVPVLLLSARAGEESQVEGLAAGADDYLVKPFGARELLARVRTHVDMAQWRRQNETRLKLLVDELNHRVKNTLATVQSIASQVLSGTAVSEGARDAIEARLIALSRSHDLLTRERWTAASLHEIAAQALEPFRRHGAGERFVLDGTDVRLPPKQALALGMAFHELATNAAKYGALSNDRGRVQLGWSVEGERLRLAWHEHGGPAVRPPSRKGFGSRLIERGLAHELDGRVRLDYAVDGVVCAIDMPLPQTEPQLA